MWHRRTSVDEKYHGKVGRTVTLRLLCQLTKRTLPVSQTLSLDRQINMVTVQYPYSHCAHTGFLDAMVLHQWCYIEAYWCF